MASDQKSIETWGRKTIEGTMSGNRKRGATAVAEDTITRARDQDGNLPPENTRRWVPRRKAKVVAAVDDGVLTVEEACERYGLSKEEFESWRRMAHQHGLKGLRVTRLQKYQERPLRRATAPPP
jgi:transposase-like protein